MSHKIGTLAEWVSAMFDASLPDWIHVLDSVKESNDKHKPAFVFFHTDSVHNYNDDSWRTQMSYSLSPQYLPPQFTPTLPRELIAGVKDWVETNSHVQLGNAIQAKYLKWYTTLKLDSGYGMIKKIYEQLPLYDRSYITAEIALRKLQTKNPNLFITLSDNSYDESLRRTDEYIGKVLDYISKLGLLEKSVIIITSSYGELLGEGGLIGHGLVHYKPLLHVPFIMCIPKTKAMEYAQFVKLIDTFPTVADIVGYPIDFIISGKNLIVKLKEKKEADKYTWIISEGSFGAVNKSILTADWHYLEVQPRGKPVEEYMLFDMVKDPGELKNVYSANSVIAQSLKNFLYGELNMAPRYPVIEKAYPDWISESKKKKLIETGYFN